MSMDDGASPDHRQRSSRDANPFGVREVLAVAQHDLFGTKDVQDVIGCGSMIATLESDRGNGNDVRSVGMCGKSR
jgi:hypothetical protein